MTQTKEIGTYLDEIAKDFPHGFKYVIVYYQPEPSECTLGGVFSENDSFCTVKELVTCAMNQTDISIRLQQTKFDNVKFSLPQKSFLTNLGTPKFAWNGLMTIDASTQFSYIIDYL